MLSSHSVCEGWPPLCWLLDVLASQPSKALPLTCFPSRFSLYFHAHLSTFPSPSLWLLHASPLQSLKKKIYDLLCLSVAPLSWSFLCGPNKKRWEEVLVFVSLQHFFPSQNHSFFSCVHSFHKYLRAKDVPGIVLGIGHTAINQTDKNPSLCRANILVRELCMINK